MSAESRPIGDIIAEAREMIAEDDVRLSGMTFFGEMPEDHPAKRLQRCRDNRAALVEALKNAIKPHIRSLHYEDGITEVNFEPSPAFELLASLCVSSLADAPNFKTAEMQLRAAGSGEWFQLTLERLEGKSLAATLRELREENARLKDENETLRRKSESLRPHDGDERTNRV